MKKIVPALAAIALCSLLAFTTGDPLTIGSPMPKADLKMKDISGKEVAMKDALKENGVLVMFSCNTCPYVIKNQERTLAISEYAIKMKVGVIILNSNEAYRGNEDSFDAMKVPTTAERISPPADCQLAAMLSARSMICWMPVFR